jgi:hypothetical protein
MKVIKPGTIVVGGVLVAFAVGWWYIVASRRQYASFPAYFEDPALACRVDAPGSAPAVVWVQSETEGEVIYGELRGVHPPRQITEPEPDTDICNPSLVALEAGYFLTWQSVGDADDVRLRGVWLDGDLDPSGPITDILPDDPHQIQANYDSAGNFDELADHGVVDYQMGLDCPKPAVYDSYDMAYCESDNTLYVVWTAPFELVAGGYISHIVIRPIDLTDPSDPDLDRAYEMLPKDGEPNHVRQARIAVSSTCEVMVAVLIKNMLEWGFFSGSPTGMKQVYPSGIGLRYRSLELASDVEERFVLVWDAYDPSTDQGTINGVLIDRFLEETEIEVVSTYGRSDLVDRLPLMLANGSGTSSGAFMLGYHARDADSESALYTVLFDPLGDPVVLEGPVRRAPLAGLNRAIGGGEMDADDQYHIVYETGRCAPPCSAFEGAVQFQADVY